MYSSNDKLIEEVKKRLLKRRKNKYNANYQENTVKYIEIKRLSTLVPKRNFGSHRDSIRRKSKINYLTEDKINLRLFPIIRSEKVIMHTNKAEDNKEFNTEPNNTNINSPRNKLNFTKPKNDYNSNIYMKTYTKILSESNSFLKMSKITRKNLFMSPFEKGKKRNKIFKFLVNFSKEKHSPKHKENNLINNNNFNIQSFKTLKKSPKKKYNNCFQNQTLKKMGIEKCNLYEKFEENNDNNCKEKKKNQFILNILNNDKCIFKNIMINKRKKIKPNCYYNKLHLIKMNNLIDKYSFINID